VNVPSAWASYATNAETEADFVVTANATPAVPISRAQLRANGTTGIPLGGASGGTTVVFRGTVSDPNAVQPVRLQVEVKPVGTAFTGTMTCQSALVTSGTAATCSVSGLAGNTSYHWQARAVDSLGAASTWASYATNAETAADFWSVLPISLGGTASGSLTDSDAPAPHRTQSKGDVYGFTGAAGQTVIIAMNSTNFAQVDPFVILVGPTGNALASNDDIDTAAGNYNSRIQFTLPTTGFYRIEATAYDGSHDAGAYTLSLASAAAASVAGTWSFPDTEAE
jgi:hypothetical protein